MTTKRTSKPTKGSTQSESSLPSPEYLESLIKVMREQGCKLLKCPTIELHLSDPQDTLIQSASILSHPDANQGYPRRSEGESTALSEEDVMFWSSSGSMGQDNG